MTLNEQMDVFLRGTAEIISPEELREKIRRADLEDRALRIKLGVDPSAPEIHLGHTVPLRKLYQLQKIGHQIIFLVGDFTGRIGDPSLSLIHISTKHVVIIIGPLFSVINRRSIV